MISAARQFLGASTFSEPHKASQSTLVHLYGPDLGQQQRRNTPGIDRVPKVGVLFLWRLFWNWRHTAEILRSRPTMVIWTKPDQHRGMGNGPVIFATSKPGCGLRFQAACTTLGNRVFAGGGTSSESWLTRKWPKRGSVIILATPLERKRGPWRCQSYCSRY